MKQKVLSMFLATLIAASIMGVAYAHWSDYVTVEGYVEMGSLTFGFTTLEASWDYEDYLLYYGDPEYKEVGNEVCELAGDPETDPHSGKTVYKLLEFDVFNAYPQYWAINKFTLDNAGSIPVKIQSVVFTLEAGFTYDEVIPGLMYVVYDERDLAVFEVWFYPEPPDYGSGWAIDPPWMFPAPYPEPLYGTQIEPCNELLTEICVHFYQDAEECHHYTFEIEIEAIQWNKFTP